jgi:hypothetical protein
VCRAAEPQKKIKRQRANGKGQMAKGKSEKLYLQKSLQENKKSRYCNGALDR